jgi:multiple sugar transport system ATP-binding protein
VAQVVFDNVSKVYPGGVKAVDRLDLTIADREFVVLVGPSGCGKTTTLRMIAGLEDVSQGLIRINGRVINDVEPKDRNVAMVFQNYALYPHMTAYKNMAFGLLVRRRHAAWRNPVAWLLSAAWRRQARSEKQGIVQRVCQAAGLLGIQELLHRRPAALSGGQRQRVAVGRAIVREPQVFLFDEPLSNLDAKLRLEMRAELKRLHRRVQTTTIYVTHDQEEAMTLGDRVVVMKDGVMQQCGTPFAIYDRPVNRFVAGFVGTPPMNFLAGRILREGERLVFDEGTCRLPLSSEHQQRLASYVGQPVTMGVRPDAVQPIAESCGEACLRIRIDVVEPLGDRVDLFTTTSDSHSVVCRVDARSRVREGETMNATVDMARAHFFSCDGEEANVGLSTD